MALTYEREIPTKTIKGELTQGFRTTGTQWFSAEIWWFSGASDGKNVFKQCCLVVGFC